MNWTAYEEWHFVDLETGIGRGSSAGGPADFIASHTPAGCVAVRLDGFNFRCQRVSWVTDDFGNSMPTAVPYRPSAPADTDLVNWIWSEEAQDWLPYATLGGLKRQAAAPLLMQLDLLDSRARRPTEELTQALALGELAPPEPLERLQEIATTKASIRLRLAAINAATSPEALAAL